MVLVRKAGAVHLESTRFTKVNWLWLLGVLLPGCLLAPIVWESQELDVSLKASLKH